MSSLATASTVSITAASYAGLPSANGDVISTPKQLTLPPIGVGAWAWGDSIFWGYDEKVSDPPSAEFELTIDIFKHTDPWFSVGR